MGYGKITREELSPSLLEELSNGGGTSGNASNITIIDSENNFDSDNVNGALVEIITKIKSNTTNINNLQNEFGNNKSVLQSNITSIKEVL